MSNYKGTPIIRAPKLTQINIEKNKKYLKKKFWGTHKLKITKVHPSIFRAPKFTQINIEKNK
jgi:hypothetical protein